MARKKLQKSKRKLCSPQQKAIDDGCNPQKEEIKGMHGLYGAKGNKDRDSGKNDHQKNRHINGFLERWPSLKRSFLESWMFWVAYAGAIIYLSLTYGSQSSHLANLIAGIVSAIVSMVVGYIIHICSHLLDFGQLYTNMLSSDSWLGAIFRRLPNSLNRFVGWILSNVVDFHDKIHHNSGINRRWYYIAVEGVQNTLTEGGILVMLSRTFGLGIQVWGESYKLNHPIALLWALMYATMHLINYRVLHPNSHVAHHMDYYKNFGLDTLDIIFNTKHDLNDPENLNHSTPNIVLIAILIIIIKEMKYDNIVSNFAKYALK